MLGERQSRWSSGWIALALLPLTAQVAISATRWRGAAAWRRELGLHLADYLNCYILQSSEDSIVRAVLSAIGFGTVAGVKPSLWERPATGEGNDYATLTDTPTGDRYHTAAIKSTGSKHEKPNLREPDRCGDPFDAAPCRGDGEQMERD